jgi:hypothetical protein
MKSSKYILGASLTLLLVLSTTLNAFAGDLTHQDYCEGSGGTWVGDDGYFGTCTYPPEHEYSLEACDEGQSLVYEYPIEAEPFSTCVTPESTPGTPADTDTHHSGNSSIPPVLSCTIASGPWRCAYFNEGTCAVNCYIDPHLPSGADHDLPDGGVYSTLYVNISPDPGGSYVVCMENPDNELFTLYQYLGGVWVPLAVSTNNPVCASATGDGSFYLGS